MNHSKYHISVARLRRLTNTFGMSVAEAVAYILREGGWDYEGIRRVLNQGEVQNSRTMFSRAKAKFKEGGKDDNSQ